MYVVRMLSFLITRMLYACEYAYDYNVDVDRDPVDDQSCDYDAQHGDYECACWCM